MKKDERRLLIGIMTKTEEEKQSQAERNWNNAWFGLQEAYQPNTEQEYKSIVQYIAVSLHKAQWMLYITYAEMQWK